MVEQQQYEYRSQSSDQQMSELSRSDLLGSATQELDSSGDQLFHNKEGVFSEALGQAPD